jgi:hypothetical protein
MGRNEAYLFPVFLVQFFSIDELLIKNGKALSYTTLIYTSLAEAQFLFVCLFQGSGFDVSP